MRALIIKTSSMGDVIHTLPALTDAVAAIPDVEFDWVVEESFAEIPRWHPAVKRVIPVALRRWRKAPLAEKNRSEWRQFHKQIKQQPYDAIIDAQGLYKSAMLAYFAHGPRHGYDFRSIREPVASLSYQQRHCVSKSQHAVSRIRQLFAEVFNYQLTDQLPDYAISRQGNAAKQKKVIFIHATSRDEKLWPETHWIELGKKINQQGFAIQLPWGSAAEKARAEHIAKRLANAEVLPKLGLTEIAKILANASASVAVDTGLAHLAAALSLPTFTLYGPTDPSLIGTFGSNQVHLRDKALIRITAEDVFAQLKTILC